MIRFHAKKKKKMRQLPSQIIVAILQLVVTTLQLVFMAFTWLNSRRVRPPPSQRMKLSVPHIDYL